jgi:hypothetical protein
MARNYFDLNINAPLFTELSKLPEWWKRILNDKTLYVNIRKGNRINVYYHGASVMELSINRNKSIQGKIHSKYILFQETQTDKNSYRKDISPETIVENLPSIKNAIIANQATSNLEGLSEKAIQGIMYVEGKYIDTEFEYVHPNRLITRIDLTTINDDGMIEFVELKRISDPRLLKKDLSLKNEEIRRQMDDYNTFISEHKENIIQYYKLLQQILKNIGVNNPLCDIAITGIKPSVSLYFAGYADGKSNHPQRRKRIDDIKKVLRDIDKNINSNINEI